MSTGRDGWVGVVTGAASGIGQATARRFVAEGGRVVGADVNEAGLVELEKELGTAAFVGTRCDITVESDVAGAFARAQEAFGGVDVVVANAGIGYLSEVVDHGLAEWQRVIDVSLTGTFLTVKHGGQALRAAGQGGSIVVVASLNAVQPGRGVAAYCAAKAGVVALTEVAAMELGPFDVRVNAVAPGLVRTSMTTPAWQMPGIVDEFVENAPLGRFAEADEIANVVYFLASDQSSFVSGSLYGVDGGARTRRYPDMVAARRSLADQSG
ncbi:SDR family NAD(P)-dependent oxidoreductase [Frankia sp. R82]|uniref:SDR family NAD(P)-dependent oxidoreductase n=1 Tax=Frankia sp. R82 TaxID=2950553 RepID=UPI0020448677|nr:SDR family NAD(P)-dependent oxidoreductase [Frankia sp. R82]MCM3886934.1 SDR family oxidoreductase [Frankia sp. R82]